MGPLVDAHAWTSRIADHEVRAESAAVPPVIRGRVVPRAVDLQDGYRACGATVGRDSNARGAGDLSEGGDPLGLFAGQTSGHGCPVRHPHEVDPIHVDRQAGAGILDDCDEISDVARTIPYELWIAPVVPDLPDCARERDDEARPVGEVPEPGPAVEGDRVDAAAVEL